MESLEVKGHMHIHLLQLWLNPSHSISDGPLSGVIATVGLFLDLPNNPLLILELLQNYNTKGVHLVHSYLNLIQFGHGTKYDCMHGLQVTEVSG